MDLSVLTLGEKMVLAARLASIEHVRLELAASAAKPATAERPVRLVGDSAHGFTDESDAEALSRPVGEVLGEVFGRLERQTPMPRATAARRRRGAA